MIDPNIQAKAIPSAEDWYKRFFPYSSGIVQLPQNESSLRDFLRDFMLYAYVNGFCKGFSDALEEKNEG